MGSNDPLATTLNFCPAVRGGTRPAFSKVKKLGIAKKSRSFEVADVPDASFAASFAPWLSLPWLWLCVGSAGGVGWPADGLAGGGVGCGVWPAPVAGGWADWLASEVSGFGALSAAQTAAVTNKQTSAKRFGFKLILAPNSVDCNAPLAMLTAHRGQPALRSPLSAAESRQSAGFSGWSHGFCAQFPPLVPG